MSSTDLRCFHAWSHSRRRPLRVGGSWSGDEAAGDPSSGGTARVAGASTDADAAQADDSLVGADASQDEDGPAGAAAGCVEGAPTES